MHRLNTQNKNWGKNYILCILGFLNCNIIFIITEINKFCFMLLY